MSQVQFVTQDDFTNATLRCGHSITDSRTVQAWSDGTFEVVCDRLDDPCGCYACDTEVQPGHDACRVPPAEMLEAELNGDVRRHFDGSHWSWWYVS